MSNNIKKFQYQGQDSLSLPAKIEAFATLRAWLSDTAIELNLAEKTKRQLLISADEIFTNIASYGYPRGDGVARVITEFDIDDQILILTFIDNGVEFNPLETSEPDINAPLDERKIGGLGVFMVKKLMDSAEYRRENDCNILILKKSIA